MAITFTKFVEDFVAVRDGIVRDYSEDDDSMRPLCEVLHDDVQLDKTAVHDAAERLALMEKNGISIPDGVDSIKLTKEHLALHGFLAAIRHEAAQEGFNNDDLLAMMFAIGRRYGMREAASAGLGNIDWDDPSLDGGDTSDPGQEYDER